MSRGRKKRHQRAKHTAQIARRRRIMRAIGRAAQSRGRFGEQLVGDALALLCERGIITSFYLSDPNTHLDSRKVDAVIIDLSGQKIEFQIKTSARGVREHQEKNPDIPCINVGECSYPEDAIPIIQRAFRLFPELPPDDDGDAQP